MPCHDLRHTYSIFTYTRTTYIITNTNIISSVINIIHKIWFLLIEFNNLADNSKINLQYTQALKQHNKSLSITDIHTGIPHNRLLMMVLAFKSPTLAFVSKSIGCFSDYFSSNVILRKNCQVIERYGSTGWEGHLVHKIFLLIVFRVIGV